MPTRFESASVTRDPADPIPTEGVDRLSLCDLIGDLARSDPGRVALRERGETLTFDGLWERTGRLAALLRHRGVKPGEVVATALPRSTDLLVACLAVMRVGGVVLALDLRSPAARNSGILSIARPAWSITRGDDIAEFLTGIPRVDLEELATPVELQEVALDPEAPAFLVFTSGSTGEPKGAVLSRRALVARARMERAAYVSGPADVVLFTSSPAFIALPVVIAYLSVGTALVVVDDDACRDPIALAGVIQDAQVTHAGFPPRLIEGLVELPHLAERLSSLRVLASFGEALSANVAARLRTTLPHCRLVDRYGATETSGVVTMAEVGAASENSSGHSAGACLPHVTIQLVDEEIWVASPALASGYLRGEDESDRRFVLATGPGESTPRLWYRTGDRGRLAPDGRLTVLGRLDLQLNIDGVRADPGEIENALRRHESVAEAAVWTHPDSQGRARLIAYLQDHGEPVRSSVLRTFLSRSLPPALIPARFIRLAAMPLTPSGKIDRARLPRPEAIVTRPVPATTAMESEILGHFRAVLGSAQLGVEDDFFDWGGDSLKAADLLARVASGTGVTLAPVVILDHPTVESLARRVSQGNVGAVTATWLSHSGDSPPLVCLPGITGDPLAFLPLTRALSPPRPVIGISLVGLTPPISVTAVVADALSTLRAVLPTGPYSLLGYSSGGLIAFEMAAELRAQGESISFVGLLDTFVPRHGRGARRRRHFSLSDWLRRLRHRVPNSVMTRLRGLFPPVGPIKRFLGPTAVRGLRRAFADHRFEPRDVAVTLFRSHRSVSRSPATRWGSFARDGVTIRVVPGDHNSILERRNLPELGRQVSEALQGVPGGAGRTG